MVLFFFKQKTAYEIGTGDWSSDVCSSDLNYDTADMPTSAGSDVLATAIPPDDAFVVQQFREDRKSVV